MSGTEDNILPVLIVGGGPTGLSLATELGHRGVECVLVEQRDGRLRVPRMSQVSARAMEFCRRWGIAEEVRGAVWTATHPMDFVYLTSLTGEELIRVKVASYEERAGRLDYSPEGSCTCPQIFFDPILAAHAMSLPATAFRYNTRLLSFEQDATAVHAVLVDSNTGEETLLSAQYMVSAEGAGGGVREALGIALDGRGALAVSINIFFRAPGLIEMHDKGWARFYRLIDDNGSWGELLAIDGKELWRLTIYNDPSPDFDPDAYLRRMAGRDFDYEIIDATPWDRRDALARSFRKGRVFIAGDTAHQCSPTGGLGMHTGMCEAVNLGWKLEAVLRGWGGPKLLESYEPECKPMGGENVAMSSRTFDNLTGLPAASRVRAAVEADPDILRRLTVPDQHRAYIRLGESAICIADGTPAPEGAARLKPHARPGTRAPHGWLPDGRTTLDLFGDGFVLLRFGGGRDGDALADAAAAKGVPFRIEDIAAPDIAALYGRKLTLVRPDGHIAWHSDAPPDDAAALIDRVRGA